MHCSWTYRQLSALWVLGIKLAPSGRAARARARARSNCLLVTVQRASGHGCSGGEKLICSCGNAGAGSGVTGPDRGGSLTLGHPALLGVTEERSQGTRRCRQRAAPSRDQGTLAQLGSDCPELGSSCIGVQMGLLREIRLCGMAVVDERDSPCLSVLFIVCSMWRMVAHRICTSFSGWAWD